MARLFYILFFSFAFTTCAKKEKITLATDEVRVARRFSPNLENKRLSIEDFFPNRSYNLELIEVDSLHPLLKITYSLRQQADDGTHWVDAVLRLPVTNEQQTLLRELLYNEFIPTPHTHP